MQGHFGMFLWILIPAGAALLTAMFWSVKKNAVDLAVVKGELKKQKQWLRRGEYNAALIKGRQTLELLLKTIAEFNGIEIDNTAVATGAARQGNQRGGQKNQRYYKPRGRSKKSCMTNQQFCRWLDERGFLDRVAKWELNQVRILGNKAVHENFDSKEEAWNQFNYLEDILKLLAKKDYAHPTAAAGK